jgi:hypothetical protein
MLFFVVHRLGGSRKSAREVAASRLFCFYRMIFGVPKWDRLRAGRRRSLPVHNPTIKVPALGPDASFAEAEVETPETILVCDDEQSVRQLVCTFLIRHGYQVLQAKNGKHALDVAEAHDGTIQLFAFGRDDASP